MSDQLGLRLEGVAPLELPAPRRRQGGVGLGEPEWDRIERHNPHCPRQGCGRAYGERIHRDRDRRAWFRCPNGHEFEGPA